jgi:RecA/RadA recombinase
MAPPKTEKKPTAGGYLAKLKEHNKERNSRVKDALKGDYVGYCGDPSLHWAIGGYMRARLNLLWGPTKSGKSTFALMWAAQEQKKTGGYVIIYDSEYNLEESNPATRTRLEAVGLDPDKVIIISSNSMNELFFGLSDLEADIKAEKLKVAAILVDSWGGVAVESAIKKIADNEISDAGNSFGGNAKFISPLIQFFLRLAGEYAITCFFVQHCMMNMDQYGKKYLLIGGQKLRYLVHSSTFLEGVEAKDTRMDSSGHVIGQKEVDDFVATGKMIRAYCDKSRQVVEGRKVEFWVDFEKAQFAKSEWSLFSLAERLGIVGHPTEAETDKKGNIKTGEDGKPIIKVKNAYWCYPADGAPGSTTWHGRPGMMEALKDKTLFDKIFKDCMESVAKNASSDGTDMKSVLAGEPEETEEQ